MRAELARHYVRVMGLCRRFWWLVVPVVAGLSPAWLLNLWVVAALALLAGVWLDVLLWWGLVVLERVGAFLDRRAWVSVPAPHLCICPGCRRRAAPAVEEVAA